MRWTAINFIESEENEELELGQRSSHIRGCVLEISTDVGLKTWAKALFCPEILRHEALKVNFK